VYQKTNKKVIVIKVKKVKFISAVRNTILSQSLKWKLQLDNLTVPCQ